MNYLFTRGASEDKPLNNLNGDDPLSRMMYDSDRSNIGLWISLFDSVLMCIIEVK